MVRGLSAQDKRDKLLEIFHETKDFYQLKELEKLGPKMKGIISQSVKDVLQELVDDGMVQVEKIGAGNFYWSFPSQDGAIITGKLEDVKAEIQKLKDREEEIGRLMEIEEEKRPPSDEREANLARLRRLKREKEGLSREKLSLSQCDAALFEQKKRGIILSKEAAERWTDNTMTVLSYLEGRGQDVNAVRNHFGIREGWEDLEVD